jgi:hypothetical protein
LYAASAGIALATIIEMQRGLAAFSSEQLMGAVLTNASAGAAGDAELGGK